MRCYCCGPCSCLTAQKHRLLRPFWAKHPASMLCMPPLCTPRIGSRPHIPNSDVQRTQGGAEIQSSERMHKRRSKCMKPACLLVVLIRLNVVVAKCKGWRFPTHTPSHQGLHDNPHRDTPSPPPIAPEKRVPDQHTWLTHLSWSLPTLPPPLLPLGPSGMRPTPRPAPAAKPGVP